MQVTNRPIHAQHTPYITTTTKHQPANAISNARKNPFKFLVRVLLDRSGAQCAWFATKDAFIDLVYTLIHVWCGAAAMDMPDRSYTNNQFKLHYYHSATLKIGRSMVN